MLVTGSVMILRIASLCQKQNENDGERARRCDDDEPLAQLVEVVDERQAILVTDWPQRACHVRRVRSRARISRRAGG